MPLEETKECKNCGNKFKVSALQNGLCALCAGQTQPSSDDNKARVVSSPTLREHDIVTIVRNEAKKLLPTREQIEEMVRKVVKEELATIPEEPSKVDENELRDVVNGILSDSIKMYPELELRKPQTVDSGKTIVLNAPAKKTFKDRVFKPKNCAKCGNEFTPKVGWQKICDNCRKEQK